MRRKLFTFCSAVSLLLLLAVCVLWWRSGSSMDVVLVGLPGGRAVMVSSHRGPGGWLEITALSGWPEPGVGAWTSPERGAGPFKFWQRHLTETYGGGRWWVVKGGLAVPRASAGGPIAYVDGRLRIDATDGWSGVPPGSPDYAFPAGHELRIPHADVAAAAALLPLLYFVFRVYPAARRAIVVRCRACAGRCTKCGYDLRGTPDRCPECGTAGMMTA